LIVFFIAYKVIDKGLLSQAFINCYSCFFVCTLWPLFLPFGNHFSFLLRDAAHFFLKVKIVDSFLCGNRSKSLSFQSKNKIETHREQFIDILMFAFDVEEIPTETHLKILENLKSYEIIQKKYIQALETEQIKFDLFCKQ
jgi:hypothetical protein